MKKRPSLHGSQRLLAVVGGLMLVASAANASLVFEADFNGSGTGTGGSGNMVTLGGSGVLGVNTGDTAAVSMASPLLAGAGGYLVTTQPASGGNVRPAVCTFTPGSAASSLNCMASSNLINGFTAMNGAFDVFVRLDLQSNPSPSAWFRLLDSDNRGNGGLRIITTGVAGANGGLQFQLSCNNNWLSNITGTKGAADPGSAGPTTAAGPVNSIVYSTSGQGISGIHQPGQTFHLGFTFKTDVNGLVTWRLFGTNGPGAINTSVTNCLLGTETFNVFGNISNKLFTTGSWSMQENGNAFTNVASYDTVRLYNSDPGVFPALVGLPAAFSGLTASQAITNGTPSIILAGKVSAPGPAYPANGETITVTINGNAQVTTINDATGDFSINYNSSTIPASGMAYPISYAYAGGATLSSASDASTTLLVSPTGNQLSTPVILKASDGVSPGQSFSINGEWFYVTGAAVAVAPDTNGQSPAVPPGNASFPAIIQTDKDAHFIVARMPVGAAPGVYNLWVSNRLGWSACWKLNAARALYMSDYQAFNGIDIEVVGRNFDASEYGGVAAARVRLNDGSGNTYLMPIKDLNPYHVTFTVGNQPPGTYYVEVSGDNGENWSRLASGQTLSVVATPVGNYDPLGLGVSWAKDFNWTNVYNVTNYGASGTNTNDCTTAVQNAANAAENAGGGVVYFPNGTYYFSSIQVGTGVVLLGQDEFNTKLYYNKAAGAGIFIVSKFTSSRGGIPQLQGVARLSILLSNPASTNARPDSFIWLGDSWGNNNNIADQTARTATRLFVTSVNLNYPYTNGNSNPADSRRGMGLMFVGKERVVVKDNQFTGWCATVPGTYLNQYYMFKNNRFEYSTGYMHDTANYLFYENNYATIHNEYDQDSHGYFGRSDAYMANNYVQGSGGILGTNNDGEGYCVEDPGGAYNYGAVLSATTNTVTVASVVPLVNPLVYYGTLSVAITYGRGLGHILPVSSINTGNGVITLARPFTVVPDATSKFALYAPQAGLTVYSNTLVNCNAGILPYGGVCDSVVADNTSIDTLGVFLFTARNGPPFNASSALDHPDFFVRITRNTAIGVSRSSHTGGIGLYTGRFDTAKFYDVETYATEITRNTVAANNTLTPSSNQVMPYYGIYISSYPFSTLSDGTGTGDATDTIIESNRLSNLPTGITLTKCNYGQLVNGNSYDNSVLSSLVDNTGSTDNTIISSNLLVTGTMLPTISAQPPGQSVLVGGTATFVAQATGNPAPFYQWRKNNVAISGATSASYSTTPAVLGDNGTQFSVMVSNAAGSVISSNAILTVSSTPIAPVITNPPPSQAVSLGWSATFTVGASGLPSPSYQWQTNGVNIPGACAASYTTPPLVTGNNGASFRCVVANSVGSVTSSPPAVLTVVDPTPSVAAGGMSAGGQFQLLLTGAPGRIYNVQASTNLVSTNWTLLASVTLTNTSAYFVDTTRTNLPQRFYRTILLP